MGKTLQLDKGNATLLLTQILLTNICSIKAKIFIRTPQLYCITYIKILNLHWDPV